HRVGVAIADRFPALRIGGSTGFQDRDISELFTNWVWSLAANVVAPLFEGGRRAAEVERTRAVLEERLHQYGGVVLRALGEVEDALSGERRQKEHLSALSTQLDDARATLEEARRRYVAGLVDYLPVLTALQSVQQVERQAVSARRQCLSFRVQLSRALGGAWGVQTPVKAASTAVPEGGIQ
ncbi:MAG: TolC family protein, partial [Myxococcota bacterium]|nr:TolC family protein [Myxococcota bacterium]